MLDWERAARSVNRAKSCERSDYAGEAPQSRQVLKPILARREAAAFWLAALLTGAGTGLAATHCSDRTARGRAACRMGRQWAGTSAGCGPRSAIAPSGGAARRGPADRRGPTASHASIERQRNRYHGGDLVRGRALAEVAYAGKCDSIRRHCRDGDGAGTRGRSKAGRRSHRQCHGGTHAPVR